MSKVIVIIDRDVARLLVSEGEMLPSAEEALWDAVGLYDRDELVERVARTINPQYFEAGEHWLTNTWGRDRTREVARSVLTVIEDDQEGDQ